MINNNLISVVTVNYNNLFGLIKTLESLIDCKCKPFEVIIIDGGSTDGSVEIISKYENILSIRFISEPDNGIYDAMNKGLLKVKTPLVHYLNSGDLAAGDLYLNCKQPVLFPVKIYDPLSGMSWYDKIKLSGYGYCHQGILFPSNHPPFDIALKIAADFDVICRTFKNGLHCLPTVNDGYIVYELGGVSTVNSEIANKEIIEVANKLLDRRGYFFICTYIYLKNLLPRPLRRMISNFL